MELGPEDPDDAVPLDALEAPLPEAHEDELAPAARAEERWTSAVPSTSKSASMCLTRMSDALEMPRSIERLWNASRGS